MKRRCAWLAVTATFILSAGSAKTQTYTWTAAANGNFSTAANWLTPPGVPVSAATTVLQFNNDASASYIATQDIAANFQLNGLIFNSPVGGVTVTNGGGNALSFVADGGTDPFLFQNSSGPATLGNTGTITFAGNATFGGGGIGAVTISSPVVFQGTSLALAGFNTTTLSNTTALPSGAFTITGNGLASVAFSGSLTGTPTSLTINTGASGFTAGFVQLIGSNSFTASGGINLQSGNLALVGTSSLGNTANVLTVTGGTIRALASLSISNPITVTNTDLIYAGSGVGSFRGVISISGNAGFQHLGSGALSIENTAAFNSFVIIGAPGLTGPSLTLFDSGAFPNIAGITINTTPGSSGVSNLVLNNTGINTNRLPSSVPIAFNGGRLTFQAGNGANSQSIGSVVVNGFGGLGATVAGGTTSTTLTFGALSLPNNATFAFRGPIVGSGASATDVLVSFTSGPFTGLAPAGSGALPILPWFVGNSVGASTALGTLVAPDGPNGVQIMTNAQFTTIPNGGSLVVDQNNYYPANANSPAALSAGTTLQINSLRVNNGTITTNISGGPSSTLRVFSGAILNATGMILSVPTLDFASRTGYIYAPQPLTVNSVITGSAGIVISAHQSGGTPNPVTLNAVNTFTGGITFNGGLTTRFTDDRQLGFTGGNVTFGGGTLSFFSPGTLTWNRPIQLTSAGGVFDTGGLNVPLVNLNSFLISGFGVLTKAGAGTLALSGNASGSWSTNVNAGVLQFTSDANFGGGTITLNGGTLQPTTAPGVFNRPIRINANSTIDIPNSIWTFSGTLTALGYTFSTGAGPSLTKAGAGALDLNASSLYPGPVTVAAGTFMLSGANGRLPSAQSFNVAAGATLQLDNSTANNNDRIGGLVTLAGGNLTVRGNSGAATTETIGALTASAAGSVLTMAPATTTSVTVTAASLVMNSGGTLLVRGSALGNTGANSSRLFFASPPTLTNGILSGVVGDSDPVNGVGSFLTTYSATFGVSAANLPAQGTTIQNAAPTNTPTTANFFTTTSTTVVDAVNTINSLTMVAGTSLSTPAASSTLTLTSGMVVAQAGAASSVDFFTTLASGPGRPLTFVTAGNLTLDGPLTSATGALNKFGSGTLTLTLFEQFNGAGPITVAAGTLAINSELTAAGLAGNGSVVLGNLGILSLNGTGQTTFFGPLSGAGSIFRTDGATGTQIFAGPITLTGGIGSRAGTLSLRNTVAASAFPILIGDSGLSAQATLEVAAGITYPRGITFTESSETNIVRTLQSSTSLPGQAPSTFTGSVVVNARVQVSTPNAVYNLNGAVSGTEGFHIGGGTLNLSNAANNFAGGVTLASNASILGIGSDTALGGGTVTVTTGGGFLQALGGFRVIANALAVDPAVGAGGANLSLIGTNSLSIQGGVNTNGSNITLDNRTSNASLWIVGRLTGPSAGGVGNVTLGSLTTIPGNTITVTGTSDLAGAVNVVGGRLQLQGTIAAGGGQVTVGQFATLLGNGTINRTTEVAGTIAPGSSVGAMNLGAPMIWDAGGNYQFEYEAVTGLSPGVNYDTIVSTSVLDLNGLGALTRFTITIVPVGNPGTTGGPVTYQLGTFGSQVLGFNPSVFSFAGTFTGNPSVSLSPNNQILMLTFTPVPEPATVLLVCTMSAAAVTWVRRRRRPPVDGRAKH